MSKGTRIFVDIVVNIAAIYFLLTLTQNNYLVLAVASVWAMWNYYDGATRADLK